MRNLIFFAMLFMGCLSAARAQEPLRGTVKDAGNKPLMAANVTLKNTDGSILSFTRTNEKGAFTLAAPRSDVAEAILEVNMMGFKKLTRNIKASERSFELVLAESSIDIKDVVVKARPILKTSGDTLNYRVKDFSSDQDRTIGDVIKNMPGMEMNQNGKISYNGKAISNFYIDGENMLDDKYNIATKSIPKEAVDKVQVIEKDQPIKMLRKKSVSDDVALNIVTTERAKLKPVGQVSLGGGLPSRFDENLSTMLFGKKYKGLNYLKGNNVGNDPAYDLTSHNLADFMKRLENNKPSPFLSGGAAGAPDLPQNRYLFNQAGLLNVNNLFNFKNDLQLKTNAYYLLDKQDRDYFKYNETYLPGTTFTYTESQHNISRPQELHTQLALIANREKNYLNNNLTFDFNPNRFEIGLNTNNALLSQQLKRSAYDFTNELNMFNTLKSGRVISVYSYINRFNQPEDLLIEPGVLPLQLNGNNTYSKLTQHVSIPTWFTNNYVSFKAMSGKISQTYKTGFTYTDQQLNSALELTQSDGSVTAPTLNAANQLNFNKTTAFVEGGFEYQGDKLTTTLALPVSYQHFNYNDVLNNLEGNLNRVYVNPRLMIKYMTGVENYLSFTYGLRNTIGGISDVYSGAILTNYRNLFANSSTIPEQLSNTASLGFNYRKAIALFFFNIQASYSNTASNTISSYQINNNLQQRVLLPFDNKTDVYTIAGNISKYWFPLRSTVSGGVTLSQAGMSQLQNGILIPFKSRSAAYKAGIISKITSLLTLNYSVNYTKSGTSTGNNVKAPGFEQVKQEASVTATVFKQLFVNLSANHMLTMQAGQPKLDYIFADANVRFKVLKLKTDFELGVTNLANIKRYDAIYVSANSYTNASYAIPGRVAMLKATFSY